MHRLKYRSSSLFWLVGLLLLLAISSCRPVDQIMLPTLQAAATVAEPATPPLPGSIGRRCELPTIPATHTPERPKATIMAAVVPTSTPKPTDTPVGCRETGQIESGTFDGPIAGEQFAYQIYLPPCYGEDGRRYPTIYMLGGNIHDETIWTELGIHRIADEGITEGTYPPFVIVMPDGGQPANFTSGGPYSYEGLILNELIPHIEGSYCVWGEPAGRAIGGLSRGGYWSLEIAFRNAAHFISVAGHSPAFLDTAAGPDLNPEFTVFSYDLSALRIYVDIGAEDYLSYQITSWHEQVAAAGIEHQWSLNPGGHDETYWSTNIPDYLSWYSQPWPYNRALYPSCTS